MLKHTKVGKHQTPFQFCSYPQEKRICILEYLRECIKRTSLLRGAQSQLLVSFVKPHKAVTKDTVARWVKTILQKSGIDTDKFTSHSTRAASTSYAKAAGLNLQQIMKSAGWSNSTTFKNSMTSILEEITLEQLFRTLSTFFTILRYFFRLYQSFSKFLTNLEHFWLFVDSFTKFWVVFRHV